MVTRDSIQERGTAAWLRSSRKATLLLGTGVGKSKVTMDILDELFKEGVLNSTSKILLLSNSEQIRDESWKEQLDEWGKSKYWPQMTSECYQTVYRWRKTKWDFVIADEFDFSLTPEYSKFYKFNGYSMLLGLTGFIEHHKLPYAHRYAPVCAKYTTNNAQDDGILNPTHLIIVKFMVSDDPVMTNKRGVKVSENDLCTYHDSNVAQMRMGVMAAKAHGTKPDINRAENRHKMATSRRKMILCKLPSSVHIAKQIISAVKEKKKEAKFLVFSEFTEQSARISEVTYNSKIPKKLRPAILDDLNNGVIRQLGLCSALNRGANLAGVNYLIYESYNGSKTAFQQRHGRGCRLRPDETLMAYILIPMYVKDGVVKPTKAMEWAKNMTSGFKPKKLTTVWLDI